MYIYVYIYIYIYIYIFPDGFNQELNDSDLS